MTIASVSRICPKCQETKPLGHFNAHKRQCKECRAAIQRGYVARNKTAVQSRNKGWRDAGGGRRSKLARYGITESHYDHMYDSQGGVCAICRDECPSGRELAVDHDHLTGEVRGLLCARCNAGIAQFLDNPDRLTAAIAYLARFQSH